jgi:diaminopimelate decarboxylase
MHDFRYKSGKLFCEDVALDALAARFGTPLYVYSRATFMGHLRKLQQAFRAVQPLICYSVKANSNLAILRELVGQGAGLDIVSGGELFRALAAGCPPERIVYASVGKTDAEIAEAIRAGILFFNVESLPELRNIERIAGRLRKNVNVALRINPDVAPKTHRYITTGKLTNKFGIDFATARTIIALARRFSRTRIRGLHIHIGSQITESAPFVEAVTKITAFIREMNAEGAGIEYVNIGGGLGIVYNDEQPQTAKEFASRVLPILKQSGLKIIMEPGRFIIGSAAVLLVRVLYVKKTPFKTFVITDGGMNDLIRPALYGAHHGIVPLTKTAGSMKADVVGPICESGDFFAKDRRLPAVKAGDFLAVMCAGAYGFSMASNYNSRRRPCEVTVSGARAVCIRKRESYRDLIRNELKK